MHYLSLGTSTPFFRDFNRPYKLEFKNKAGSLDLVADESLIKERVAVRFNDLVGSTVKVMFPMQYEMGVFPSDIVCLGLASS